MALPRQEISPVRQRFRTLLLTLVLSAAVAAGCATSGGRSAKEAVQARIEAWRADMLTMDYDAIMVHYSEDFENAEGLGKNQYHDYLMRFKEYMSAMQIDLSTAEITIDGGTATANAIEITVPSGPYVMDMTLRNESGTWLIYRSKVPY